MNIIVYKQNIVTYRLKNDDKNDIINLKNSAYLPFHEHNS